MQTSPALQDIRNPKPITAEIEHNPNKPRRIPRAIVRAIDLLVTGECANIKAAAERVGITREWLSRCLQRDHVRVFAARKSRETIAAGIMRASARLVDLVDAGSEHVSLDATKHLLGIGGIAPVATPNVNVNITMKAGYVIDLSEAQASHTLPTLDLSQTSPNENNDLDADTSYLPSSSKPPR